MSDFVKTTSHSEQIMLSLYTTRVGKIAAKTCLENIVDGIIGLKSSSEEETVIAMTN